MKKLFKRKKKSSSDAGSLASGRSASGYNVSPKKDLTKIHKAAFDNDITKLKAILKKGDINLLDKENRTALHLACAQGNVDAVRLLVNHPQCNLNLCDNDRRSALMKCVQCQFQECLEVLIQKRADVNLSDANGNTALHLSAAIPSLDACCLLLDSNANVHEKNKEGQCPLHIASMTEGSESLITNLLDDGAQVNALDNNGKTPLMLAASRGYLETVKLLLEKKADASLKDSRGWSADDYASMSGHHPISMIIFEYSQKQDKQKGVKSLPAGDHVYSSVPRTSGKVLPKTASGSFLTKNDDDSDLSFSDELSELSDEKDTQSDEKNFLPEKSEPIKKPASVNVAQFLKQRQMNKNKSTEDDEVVDADAATNSKLKVQSAVKSSSENLEDESSSNSSEDDVMRQRGYNSNSRKGGQVSPAKPPLPNTRNSGSLNSSPAVARTETPRQEEEDDSPWDSEEDEEEEQEVKPAPTKQSSAQFNKPDKKMMAELGLSEDDIKDLYTKSSDESIDFSSHTAVSKDDLDGRPVDLTVYSTENKQKNANHPVKVQEDVVSAASSSWDEEEEDHELSHLSSPVKNKVADSVFAGSSAIKLDDELSEEEPPPAVKPSSSSLKAVGVYLDSDEDGNHEDESSSEWDSEAVKEDAMLKKPSVFPDKTETSNSGEPSHDGFSDDDSTESESSWERQNRENRKTKQELTSLDDKQEEATKNNENMEELRRKEVLASEQYNLEQKRKEEEKIKQENFRIGEAERKSKKAIALEAAEKVRRKEEERARKEKEERRRKQDREDDAQLLASQDREKIEAALKEALDGSVDISESDVSELDDSYAPPPHLSRKMGDARTSMLPLPRGGFTKKGKLTEINSSGALPINGNDPTTWTATETESEVEEDLAGNIPSSLRSSQLSESLLRSGERGELEREAAKEKRRAVDAIEQLDYARRNIESLTDRIEDFKKSEDEWSKSKNELEASIRKLNFDHNRLKEQLSSSELDLKKTKERMTRLNEQLELETGSRRKQEVTIRELRNDLKVSEQTVKMLEDEKEKILKEKHEASLHDQVSRERDRIERETHEENTHDRQFEALELLMQEKDLELRRAKAERDTFEEACERYKEELSQWHGKGDDQTNLLGKLNEELNDKIQELSCDLKESDEALQQAALQYTLKLNTYKQANDVLAAQIKREQTEKENVILDLESLNEQQMVLKKHIEEAEDRCRKEENKSASLEGELKVLREKRSEVEQRLHSSEVSDTLTQQEASSLRTTLAHKESLITQLQQDKEEARERFKSSETELNDFRRENAKLLGRIATLEGQVPLQDSEQRRLRSELEGARNSRLSHMSAQQEKLNEIMTDAHLLLSGHMEQLLPSAEAASTSHCHAKHQREKLELEKENVRLNEQVTQLRNTLEEINEEKLKKEKELADAQQDQIEAHKRLSFTEPTMVRLTESQQQFQEEIKMIRSELEASRARCQSFETRTAEANQLLSSLRAELEQEKQAGSTARRELQALEMNRSRERDNMLRMEDRVKEMEITNNRLQADLASSSNRERNVQEDQSLLARSQLHLEELVASLQDEKISAEEKMKSESHRCQILQSEADGHRKMWESEVKARSKLSVEFAKADKERKDALKLLDAYKEKLKRSATQSKTYRTKFENQKKHRSKLEDRIEHYSQQLAESKLRSDTSESECESRLSRMSEQFGSERTRLDETIRELQLQVSTLGRKLSEESLSRTAAEQELKMASEFNKNDSSISDLERERDELREELRKAKSLINSPNKNKSNAIINAEVNAKLDQVNTWLEERAVAQDTLERLRFANEEKRVAEAYKRVEEYQRELSILRGRSPRQEKSDDSRLRGELQQMVREKIDLQEKLQKAKHEIEENKQKLSHEKKKYQQLHMSALSGAIAANIGAGLPAATPHSLRTSPMMTSVSPRRDDVMTSTPRKDIPQPMLAQLRNKLDTSIAIKLANGTTISSPVDGTGLNQRRPDDIGSSRPSSNEYLLIP